MGAAAGANGGAFHLHSLSFGGYVRILSGVDGPSAEAALRRMPRALPSYLAGGGFPEHVGRPVGEIRRHLRHEIAERAILRDLLGLGVDVQRVKDLFVRLAQTSGEPFDAGSHAARLDADPRSVRRWVDLLLETDLIVPLGAAAHTHGLGSRTRLRLYAADHGLVSAFLPGPAPHRDPVIRAALFKTAVLRHLRELPGARLAYDRPSRGRRAADFVVELDGRRTVLSVTVAQSLAPGEAAGLRGAARRLDADDRALIHAGTEGGEEDGVRLVPLHRFLLDPAASLAP